MMHCSVSWALVTLIAVAIAAASATPVITASWSTTEPNTAIVEWSGITSPTSTDGIRVYAPYHLHHIGSVPVNVSRATWRQVRAPTPRDRRARTSCAGRPERIRDRLHRAAVTPRADQRRDQRRVAWSACRYPVHRPTAATPDRARRRRAESDQPTPRPRRSRIPAPAKSPAQANRAPPRCFRGPPPSRRQSI